MTSLVTMATAFMLLLLLAWQACGHLLPNKPTNPRTDDFVINPKNWPPLGRVPADVLSNTEMLVIGDYAEDIIVHTRDCNTYLFSDHYGDGRKPEMDGVCLVDIRVSKTTGSWSSFFALLTNDGRVFTAGCNILGQLGHHPGHNEVRDFSQVLGLGRVEKLDVGQFNTIALTQDKQVYVWGFLVMTFTSDPTKINFSDENFRAGDIAVGWGHWIVMSEDGKKILTWGSNWEYQLGLGVNDPTTFTEPQEALTPTGSQFQKVFAGNAHSYALDNRGQLWTWGSNSLWRLGRGDQNYVTLPQAGMRGLENRSVTSLRIAETTTLAATLDGGMYTWGTYKPVVAYAYPWAVPIGTETPMDFFANSRTGGTGGAVRLHFDVELWA